MIALALKYTMGWRVTEDVESDGIDQSEHGESGYDLGGFTGGRFGSSGAVSTSARQARQDP